MNREGNNALKFSALILIYLIFSIPHSPFFESLGYDKEVFQYIGMLIKNGQLPYTDVFDHKPPVIYLINYLGILITPKSTWGIFLILNIIGFISFLLIYKIAFIKFKNFFLSIALAAFFISSSYYYNIMSEPGNLTRQLTAYLTVIIIYIVFVEKRSYFFQTITGFLIGVIFFTQQNEVLSGFVLVFYSILFERKFVSFSLNRILKNCTYFIIGLIIPIIGIVGIINNWDNFDAFLDQVFLFNLNDYIEKKSFFSKILNFTSVFITNRIFISIIIFTIINVIFNRIKERKIKLNPELIVLSIAFIFQILSSSISGKTWRHYFLMYVPFLTCLFIFSFRNIIGKRYMYIIHSLLFTLTMVVTIQSYRYYYHRTNNILYKMVSEKVAFVENNQGQFYTFNARYLRINFDLNITSPSKYVYTHFFDKEKTLKLIKDLKKNNTTFILYDSKNPFDELKIFFSSNYNEIINHENYILFKKK